MCNVPECKGENKARGLCSKHYSQWLRHGKLTPESERTGKPLKCIVEECEDRVRCKGYCAAHYEQNRTKGTINKKLQERNKGRQCKAKDCGREAIAKRYCNKHWNQIAKHGELKQETERPYCKKEDCYLNVYYKGQCLKHFCETMSFTKAEAYTYKLRESRTLKSYNISLEEKKALWVRQEHKCLICKRYQNLNEIHIDHTETEEGEILVRGLLCRNCNLGIGNLQHNIDILRSAIQYLQGKSHVVSISYSVGELIDRISISELKLHALRKIINQKGQTKEDKGRINEQIKSQETHLVQLKCALTAYMDEQQIDSITKITKANLSIWDLESQMADLGISDEDKAKIQDEIIKNNTLRVKTIESIAEFYEGLKCDQSVSS